VSTVVHPIVNLNGAHRDDLRDQATAARGALNRAMEVLQDAAPHGRDYPTPGTYETARAQHQARLVALKTVLNDLTEIEDALWDGAA
jgi:hypothetical protein